MRLLTLLAMALVFLMGPMSFAANEDAYRASQGQEKYLSRMQEQLQQLDTIGATQDPAERQRLFLKLRHSMQELMQMMRNQPDMAGSRAGPVPGMTF